MMFPTYNTGHLIVQTPGYVTISSEMIHLTRNIPLDGRPAPHSNLRQWDGVPRGHWEGNTFVVEVTNYNTQGTVGTNAGTRRIRGVPQSEAMRVTERFIPVDENTLLYRVTVDDPNAFETPWTVELPMNRSPDYRIYEYSCHEGNYGLENTLRVGVPTTPLVADGFLIEVLVPGKDDASTALGARCACAVGTRFRRASARRSRPTWPLWSSRRVCDATARAQRPAQPRRARVRPD